MTRPKSPTTRSSASTAASAGASTKLPTARWRRTLAEQLLAWFGKHQRDLPWRRTQDPYAVWVSEIMLQQTQVATVVPYFERFLTTFPSIVALAEADEHEVLRLWEGLGYYRRARQMHRAARVVRDEHGGQFPNELEAVRQLPGIGRYTAGAIVSIAFDTPAPILEANTLRLFSRLIGFAGDPTSTKGQRLLWQLAEAVLPGHDCGQFNQALMELGALVCTPRSPACDVCPLARHCRAREIGQQETIPRKRAAPRIEQVREAAVVVWRKDKILLRRREPGQRWAGLWDFLRFELSAQRGAKLEQELLDKVRGQSGLIVETPRPLATLKHGVTRFQITLDCFAAECRPGSARLIQGEWRWVDPAALAEFPLSVTGRKISRLVEKGHSPV